MRVIDRKLTFLKGFLAGVSFPQGRHVYRPCTTFLSRGVMFWELSDENQHNLYPSCVGAMEYHDEPLAFISLFFWASNAIIDPSFGCVVYIAETNANPFPQSIPKMQGAALM